MLLLVAIGRANAQISPAALADSLRAHGLDKRLEPLAYCRPAYFQQDLDRDGRPDLAILVVGKTDKKKGVVILSSRGSYTVFGAGFTKYSGYDDFLWLSKWKIWTEKIVQVPIYDKKSGEIIDAKNMLMAGPGLMLMQTEGEAWVGGGLIYWDGHSFTWIHHGP